MSNPGRRRTDSLDAAPIGHRHQRGGRTLKLRRLFLFLAAVAIVCAVLFVAVAWYYTGQIYDGALKIDNDRPFDLEVLAVDSGSITLAAAPGHKLDDNLSRDGVWGLHWAGGYAQIGNIVSTGNKSVTRAVASGIATPTVGERVRLDNFAFPADPRASGLAYRDVTVKGEQGDLPAWLFGRQSSDWLITVHGKGASRGEALRLVSGLPGGLYTVLAISYRNDAETAASSSGRYDYGRTEWHDLEAAVKYARGAGAKRIIIVAYSMGGSITMSFLEHSPEKTSITGLVLDAPLLDLGTAIDYAGERKHLPQPLTSLAKTFTKWRYGVNWPALDHRSFAATQTLPILLFHGDADPTVPISTSERLAKARPESVHFERFEGAAHVRSWNVDPARYAAAVRSFLASVFP